LLQDDAYVRLFLFRAYRRLGNDEKASEHLRASVDLSDETRDQSFLETLVKSATPDEGTPVSRGLHHASERTGAARWTPRRPSARGGAPRLGSKTARNLRMRDA
jgi:hypothetical protein